MFKLADREDVIVSAHRQQRQYTDAQRAEALELYQELGASETARRLDISPRTVRYWATQANLAKARTQNLEEAATMLAAEHKAKREELRLRLMDQALDALDRMDQRHIDFRGKDAMQVEWATAPADAYKAYATSAAILIDKYRLEMGESTGRMEVSTFADEELRRMAEEFARQAVNADNRP